MAYRTGPLRGLAGSFATAAAARVGRFSLLAVLILVADEYPALETGVRDFFGSVRDLFAALA
jgi:hypothetical protein